MEEMEVSGMNLEIEIFIRILNYKFLKYALFSPYYIYLEYQTVKLGTLLCFRNIVTH